MEFTSFTTLVKDEVEKRTGENYRVRLSDVRKNNGIILKGITVTQEDNNIAPTIYLNNYYQAYEEGLITLRYIVNDVMDTYNKNKVNKRIDMKHFLDFDSIKDSIVYKLVNTVKNKELLEDIPHLEFMDLSIIFQSLVVQESQGIAYILIHNAHLRLWDISLEELYKAAMNNTQQLLGYELKSLQESICEMIKEEQIGGNLENENGIIDIENNDLPLYVLSNKNKIEGASCILYPKLIKNIADELESSLYIIPSSIHEVLILPSTEIIETTELKNMIREINDSQVKLEEVLSYSLYFFDRDREKMVKM